MIFRALATLFTLFFTIEISSALPPLPWIQKRADKLSMAGMHVITEDFSGDPQRFRPQPSVDDPSDIDITYLGASGLLIQRGTAAILTAPYFSNESLERVGTWRIEADKALIDQHCPDLSAVRDILVGHAHYDHLLDVPHIWRSRGQHTTVYGNQSMAHILHGADPQPRVHAFGEEVRRDAYSGRFISSHGGQIQFMPIRSSHAPNIRIPIVPKLLSLSALVARWAVDKPLGELPTQARDWRLGQTLAYIIDFRNPQDATKIDFRIYFQDAAHIPEGWHLPADGRSVDLAIITVASSNFIGQQKYIAAIRDVLQPKHWLLSHWEDFFHAYSQDPQRIYSVPLTNPEDFIGALRAQRVRDEQWVLPTPGTKLRY